MILSAALLISALVLGLGGPFLLTWTLRAPVTAPARLVVWLVLVGGFFASLTAAPVVALLPGHGPALQLVGLIDSCWASLQHGEVPSLEKSLGAASAVLTVGALVTVVVSLVRHRRSQRRLHRRHLDALTVVCRQEAGPIRTWWLPVPDALAYSVAGEPALIVATDGLAERLSPEQLAAVLDHERAHVRGHHHMLVGASRALAEALPWLPLARRSPAFVAVAVELCADASTAAVHGPATVRAALSRMTDEHRVPPAALAMAGDFVELRLHHLRQPPRRTTASRGRSGLAVVATALLPLLVTVSVLALAGALLSPAILGL
jgi:Zn-dependent protease with chaperone function